jgi:hypothetical protein
VLKALRQAGVRPAKIRPALDRLAAEFGREYVLVAPNLSTDGIDVLWDFSRSREGRDLMEGSTGQLVMREIVGDYLKYVTWAADAYPSQLQFPYCLPSKVIIDPYRAWGQPVFAGVGENPQVVADGHGVSIDDVRTAARVLLGRAP